MTTTEFDNRVTQLVANIRNLPTPPIVFHQIERVISDPMVSAGAIAKILSEDPAMSVKVLKLTNSAFYGLSREVESVKQAVIIVGLEAIKNLVLSAAVLDMFKGKNLDQDYQEGFWRHSLAVGFSARILARRNRDRGIVDPDSAFSAGLLHDIGKIIMCCYLPAEHGAIKEARESDPMPPDYVIEERIIGFQHTQLGAALAKQWKLPERLIEAIRLHHRPWEHTGEDLTPWIINLADHLAWRTFTEGEETNPSGPLDQRVVQYFDWSDEDSDEIAAQLHEEYLKAETFMKLAGID